MPIISNEGENYRVPDWVMDHSSFRRWLYSDEFPEKGCICYLNDEVWIDLSPEDLFSHNQVKLVYLLVLHGLIKQGNLGTYFIGRAMVSNVRGAFSSQPDGTFVSRDAFVTERVRIPEGEIELEGSPDMVLEVVSKSSVHKDNVLMRNLYWQAGIREYWLVDARGERLDFEILRHTAKGYVSVRSQNRWVKSGVFGKSFQLSRTVNEHGIPVYTLAVR